MLHPVFTIVAALVIALLLTIALWRMFFIRQPQSPRVGMFSRPVIHFCVSYYAAFLLADAGESSGWADVVVAAVAAYSVCVSTAVVVLAADRLATGPSRIVLVVGALVTVPICVALAVIQRVV